MNYTEMAAAMRAFDPAMAWAVLGGSTRRSLLWLALHKHLDADPQLSRKRCQRTMAKWRATRPPLAAPLDVGERLTAFWKAQA
jgi:hypothetical protein